MVKSIIQLDIQISQHTTSAGDENLKHKPVDNRGIYFSCDNHGGCGGGPRRSRNNHGRNRHLECAPTPGSVEGKILTHRGPVTQYCGGSILCKNPIFFAMKEFPQV